MDEKLIRSAAETAARDLELADCEVASVYKRKDDWCVKFSGQYGELCDEFRSRLGEENSAEVVREKLKRHLLKSPKPTGRRKGARSRSASTGSGNSLLDLPLQIAGGALRETVRAVSEAVGGTLDAAETALNTVTDAASAVAQTAAQTTADPPSVETSISLAASEPVQLEMVDEPLTPRVVTKSAKKSKGTSTKKSAKKSAKKSVKKSARKPGGKKSAKK